MSEKLRKAMEGMDKEFYCHASDITSDNDPRHGRRVDELWNCK